MAKRGDKKMYKILIVDSDIMTYDLIKIKLNPQYYKIFSALHGAIALDIIEKYSFDCVIVDLNVAHVNGLEIIDLLQVWDTYRPWIIATCQQNNPDSDYPWLDLATSMGADEILTKPYHMEQLLDLFPASLTKAQNHYVDLPVHNEQLHRGV